MEGVLLLCCDKKPKFRSHGRKSYMRSNTLGEESGRSSEMGKCKDLIEILIFKLGISYIISFKLELNVRGMKRNG